MQVHNPHRPRRQDTFDLRDQIHTNDPHQAHQHYQQVGGLTSDSELEHSVMEDSSDAEGEDTIQDGMDIDHGFGAERDHDLDDGDEDDTIGDYMSDSSSSLSIPNESIDFDLVYSLTNFAATVEGQASVVKGDSLFLMDDSNSYWWLVRVLKTQEVGYIPAENIETPFERLARLNRHRNVDLASATQAELDDLNPAASKSSRSRNRVAINAPDTIEEKRSVIFKRSSSVFRYPPAVWNEDEEDMDEEWTESDLEVEDAPIKDTSQEDGFDDDEMPMQEPDIHDHPNAQPQHMEDVELNRGGTPRPTVNIPAALQAGNVTGGPQSASPIGIQQEQQLQLRNQTSQERLRNQQAEIEEKRLSPMLDPAEETGTRKLVITPSIARDEPSLDQQPKQQQQQQGGTGPLLPSAILQKRQEQMELERKRAREEIEAAEEASRRRGTAAKGINIGLGQPPAQSQAQPQKELVRTPSQETRSSSGSGSGGGKLRKERSDKDTDDSDGGKDKKKKGMFGGLFSRNKSKDKGGKSSIENIAAVAAGSEGRQRTSDESGVSSSTQSHTPSSLSASQDLGRAAQSPSPGSRGQPQQRTITPVQQPQQQGPAPRAMATSPTQNVQQTQPLTLQVSQHASSLRDRDQQQQALYSEYLKRSPSSPPDQPSYATQPASLVMPMSDSGSLTSSPNNSGYGLGLAPVNSSRTPGGRPGSLILTSNLGNDGQGGVPELSVIRVFAGRNLQSEATFKTVLLNTSTTANELIRQSMQRFRLGAGEDMADYYLTVKQVEGSSLRLKPDEKPLGVFEQLVEEAEEMPLRIKRSSMGSISSVASNLSSLPAIRKLPMNDFTDDSAVKFYLNREGGDDSPTENIQMQASETPQKEGEALRGGQYLSVATSGLNTVEPERFSSPALRFAMQLVIYPEELPDNMVFDPHTEAIVFKETLRDRSVNNATVSPGVSQNQRKKFFNLPKNMTVAEVIELGLERFGILEGVVDGGDEVEDKLTKRRSSSRVRYTLMVSIDKQERELAPSSKVIDAFPRPPNFRRSSEFKRRSMDSGQHLLGSPDDVKSDDPIFVLRRAVAYKPTNYRHHRLSAPLDELALSHLRDSTASDSTASPTDAKGRQPSKQEIIAAQRAASRANQKAVLSTQANGQRGVDVTLPDKGVLRSQHFDADNKMRYSYTEPDGETYDISDIVEEELRSASSNQTMTASSSTSSNDLLSGAMAGSQPSTLINRVLDKIKNGPASSTSDRTFRSNSPSTYSDEGSRAATPTGPPVRLTGGVEPEVSRSRSATPTAAPAPNSSSHKQYQPSIASVMSDATSDYRTAASSTPLAMASMTRLLSPSPPGVKRPKLPKDDFGISEMLAIIHSRADLAKPPPQPEPDEVDKMLFGIPLNIESVHPKLRDIYAPTYQKMKDIDTELDILLQKSLRLF